MVNQIKIANEPKQDIENEKLSLIQQHLNDKKMKISGIKTIQRGIVYYPKTPTVNFVTEAVWDKASLISDVKIATIDQVNLTKSQLHLVSYSRNGANQNTVTKGGLYFGGNFIYVDLKDDGLYTRLRHDRDPEAKIRYNSNPALIEWIVVEFY